jgi:ribosomal protein S4
MEMVAEKNKEELKKLLIELSRKKNINLPNYINENEISLEQLFKSLKEMNLISSEALTEIIEILEK